MSNDTEQKRIKRHNDPEYRKHYNEMRKTYYHRRMQEPEYRAMMQAKIRRFREKHSQMPVS